MPERIGVFGGTFDPPHVGHLVTAVNVRYALGLDRVLLVVANVPWQKEGQRDISDGEDRLALVEAAVGPVAGLEASRSKLDRGGPSYRRHAGRAGRPPPGCPPVHGPRRGRRRRHRVVERHDEVAARSSLVVVERPGWRSLLPEGSTVRVEVPISRCRAPTCEAAGDAAAAPVVAEAQPAPEPEPEPEPMPEPVVAPVAEAAPVVAPVEHAAAAIPESGLGAVRFSVLDDTVRPDAGARPCVRTGCAPPSWPSCWRASSWPCRSWS